MYEFHVRFVSVSVRGGFFAAGRSPPPTLQPLRHHTLPDNIGFLNTAAEASFG